MSTTVKAWPVVCENFCTDEKRELTVARKPLQFNGGLFTVTDATGSVVYQVERTLTCSKQILVVKDGKGIPLLSMHPQEISLRSRWKANVTDGAATKTVFSARKTLTTGCCLYVEVAGTNNKISGGYSSPPSSYSVKGSFSHHSFAVYTRSGHLAAQVAPKYQTAGKTMARDVLSVVVEEGFDQLFVVALVVILECINA